MKPFWVSEIMESHGERTLYLNPLPKKYCSFDCVFCPMEERTAVKTDKSFYFEETEGMLLEIEKLLREHSVDKVFIVPEGEGLANQELNSIIDLVKSHGCKVKIISNGYILNHDEYKTLLMKCDEVIGELMTCREADFQKLQRPLAGYTLEAYVDNMVRFRRDFKGEFNLAITLLKNYSDDDAALTFFKAAVSKLKPSNVYVETPEDGKLQQAFGVDEATIARFTTELNA